MNGELLREAQSRSLKNAEFNKLHPQGEEPGITHPSWRSLRSWRFVLFVCAAAAL
jgi:hypothetical protein